MHAFAISPCFSAGAAAVAAVGGVLLGCTIVFKTGATGEVLGCSGTVRGLLLGKDALRNAAFSLGMALAGAAVAAFYGGFEPLPKADTAVLLRLGCGGVLVGFGTALGNGCTSGHGLTGLARLSLRSWVAVPTFMAVAMATATALGTSAALPPAALAGPALDAVRQGAAVAACAAGTLLLAALAAFGAVGAREDGAPYSLKVAFELLSGAAFGLGLAISTMVRPSKVASFLDLGSGAWDPSLAFVMGGGLLVTFPFYQAMACRGQDRALLGGALALPPLSKPVDRSLVAGAALFGVGWGACGVCPGPLLVLLGAMPASIQVGVTMAGMVVGMCCWIAYDRLGSGAPAVAQSDDESTSVEDGSSTEETEPPVGSLLRGKASGGGPSAQSRLLGGKA